MRTPKGYTTLEQIENYLLIHVDDSFHEQVNDWIAKIETYIEKLTGRVFILDDETEATEKLYDGDGSRVILIDDAIEIEKVEYGNDDDGWEEMDELYYYPANETPKTKIESDEIFPKGKQNIKITAKWANSASVPADIEFAATIIVSGIILNQLDPEQQSMTIGSYSVSYKDSQGMDDIKKAQEILRMNTKMGF
jgi:hypothetical protein